MILKAGTASPSDLICYTSTEQGVINGLIAEGNVCLSHAKGNEIPSPRWYNNQWVWFLAGIIVGGGATVYILK